MYLTKNQIKSFFQKIEQPRASVLLNHFFNAYRMHLTSRDVKDIYDDEYLERLSSHDTYLRVAGKFKINIYTKYAYDYLVPKLTKNTRLLDIGCGSGDFALAIATHGITAVVGLDFSRGAIEAANAKLQASQLNNCSFVCADISELSCNILFDYVVLNDIVEHLADSELITLFANIKTILSKDGEIIIHTPNGLALCNDTDSNLVQQLFKIYMRIFSGWKGQERSIEQFYYDQTHINIKSYSQFNDFLKNLNFKSTVHYDEGSKMPFMSQLLSNMLIVAKKQP